MMEMGDETRQLLSRKPLANFVFYPAIQWPQIVRNCLLVTVTALLSGLMIVLLYQWQYGSTSIYVMDQDSAFFPLERRSLVILLLPALVSAILMAILLGWLLALAASRRIALPIFKVIQWSKKVSEGNLRTQLAFRPGDRLDELARSCNVALEQVRAGFEDLRDLEREESLTEEQRTKIRMILARYRI